MGSVFVVLGIVGNILSVCVLCSKQMRRGSASVCRLLVGLGVYDTVFLFSHGVAGNLPHVLHHMGIQLGSAGAVMFSIFYPLLHISRTGSVYTTVMVTVERCVAVVKPLKAAVVFTQKRTNQILVAILMFSFIFNIPRCMEHRLDIESSAIILSKSVFYSTTFYSTIYLVYFNFIFNFVVPFTLIAFFNITMLNTIRKSPNFFPNRIKTEAHILVRTNQSQKSDAVGTGNRLFAIVSAVTIVFFLCHLVPAVALVMEQMEHAQRLGECSSTCSKISSVGEMFIIACSAVNFLLYCFFGRKFRYTFMMFCKSVGKHRSTSVKGSFISSLKRTADSKV
ncbi:FMRFamide receptor-like [Haliotis rubra]|uniref:FMRFamide receptor-like n=1 Tax=Haliotis rubra TaxID=36100 RepID=UPI001EE538C6|nr:FMRFamide receptor-like [Haliotis rubra]